MNGFLPRSQLQLLLEALLQAGYKVIAPKVIEGRLRFAALRSWDELAAGWGEQSAPGSYQAMPGGARVFGPGPGSVGPKHLFNPPRQILFTGQRQGPGFTLQAAQQTLTPLAILGLKACDLAAIAIMEAQQRDLVPSSFHARSQGLFTVVVDCQQALSTCFCTQLGQNPAADSGFDLGITELKQGFILRSGSDKGADLLRQLPLIASTPAQQQESQAQKQALADQLPKENRAAAWAKGLLAQVESAQWAELGSRCLACGNCTQACPTCFCHNYVDELSFDGQTATRVQEWDSCFFNDYSYLHGTHARKERGQRYRHWISHKLSHWQSQFGTPGCTGCGRCITWCPVGIDIRAEAEQASQREGL